MEPVSDIDNKIYRFKYSEHINELLCDFSKKHLYDSKSILIDQYDNFWEENIEVFEREKYRLQELNFNQDLKKALFRSIKYYHIKKYKKESENYNKEETKDKTISEVSSVRDYIKLNKFIIQWIDTFIINNMRQDKNFKPSKNYNSMIENKNFQNLLIDEKPKVINKYKEFLQNRNETKTYEEIEEWWDFKVKKTHKNRYFSIKTNNKKR